MPYWTDKVALVTGGSKGLGLAIARAFVAAGAHVVITARDQEQLATSAAALSKSDRKCSWVPADITQQDQVDAMFVQVQQLHSRLDVLVNCAGRSDRGEAAILTADKFRALLELNFLSAVRCTRA